MQTRDEVEGFYNCREFSQPLECLYQAIQIQERSFLLLLKIKPFPRKNAKLFVMALIKREILTTHKVLYTEACTRIQFLFCKKDASKYGFFSLKISA